MLKGQNEIRMIWLMALIIAGIGMWYAEFRQFSYLCGLAFAISVMHYVDDLQKPAEQLAAEAGLPLEMVLGDMQVVNAAILKGLFDTGAR